MRLTSTRTFVIAGIAVALVLAFMVSPFASSSPDGLERVASDKGIDIAVTDHALADGPLADYAVQGVDNAKVSTGLAGVVGVAATFAVGMGLFVVLRIARRETSALPTTQSPSTAT